MQSEQEHSEELESALHEREDRITQLTQERQYALESVTRLESNLRERDAGDAGLSKRILHVETEAESLREELSRVKREHARTLDLQARELEDARSRETVARAHMEAVLKEKAEGDVYGSRVQDRTGTLESDLEKLRRQIHDLQHESADKDMRIIQLMKHRTQDKDDMDNLNIALDSKQQELEMVRPPFTAISYD